MSSDAGKTKEEIKTNLDRFLEDQRVFSRDFKTTANEYQKNMDIIKKSFESAVSSIVKDYEAIVGPLEQRKNQALKTDADTLRSKLKDLVQKTNTLIQAEGKNFQNAIEGLIKSSVDIVKQNISTTSTNVENVYDSEENAIDIVRTGLMNSVDKAKELYSNAVKQKIESVRSTTDDMMEEVTANLKQFKSQASTITRGGQDEIDA